MKVLGKQLQSYVKNYQTGEVASTKKICVGDLIDDEVGEGFGNLANTYTVNNDDYSEVFSAAEIGDEVKLVVETKTPKDGKSYEKVTTFMIRKKDGSVIGW